MTRIPPRYKKMNNNISIITNSRRKPNVLHSISNIIVTTLCAKVSGLDLLTRSIFQSASLPFISSNIKEKFEFLTLHDNIEKPWYTEMISIIKLN